MSEVLEFRDVWRHFGDTQVLRGLSFGVRPGEVFALLGRNGAGKTTALRILLGFLDPHAGEARILGRSSTALQSADRDRIGYVAEGQRLYPELKVADALLFEAATRPRFDLQSAREAVRRCGLPEKRRIAFLSRGMRAQLALILAVSGRPDVLVFDDPAMGLDVAMRRELLDVLIEFLAERGSAVLLSSHILSDVERLADRVGILHDGALIVDASLDELKRRVTKRHWLPAGVNGARATVPAVDGVLRARAVAEGFELTLLDCDPAREQLLSASGARLTEPVVPDLEELFLDLTIRQERAS